MGEAIQFENIVLEKEEGIATLTLSRYGPYHVAIVYGLSRS